MAVSGSEKVHDLAPHHIPGFLPDATGHDPLLTGMAVVLVIAVLGVGTLYFRLHSLPEHMAHGTGPSQLQIVSILALLALFTHNNLFWVLALLLAAVKIPDFLTPLNSIARSLERATDAPDKNQGE